VTDQKENIRVRALSALFDARRSGVGGGWVIVLHVARAAQASQRYTRSALVELELLGHAETREVMGREHFRITPGGGGYLLALREERGQGK
jgi:hypothetical protein